MSKPGKAKIKQGAGLFANSLGYIFAYVTVGSFETARIFQENALALAEQLKRYGAR